MGILTLQKRGRKIGEIRIGAQVETKSGKKAPAKLDAFRFTTKSESIAEAVANLFGGEAQATELLNGDKTFEVFTNVTELPVMVPPGDQVISQWNELWLKGGKQRQCDGVTEQLTQEACKCPFDTEQRNAMAAKGQACKPVTRLNVMLPDLPDLGVWLISSNGYNAAVELGGTADVLAAARDSGVIIPAKLRLEQRQSVKAGQTRKFAVPVLELNATLRQMTALGAGDISTALPPPPPQAQGALGSGTVSQIARKVATVDLWSWIETRLDEAERNALQPIWNERFAFKPTAVPVHREAEMRMFVNDFHSQFDDEVTDAEIVYPPGGEPF